MRAMQRICKLFNESRRSITTSLGTSSPRHIRTARSVSTYSNNDWQALALSKAYNPSALEMVFSRSSIAQNLTTVNDNVATSMCSVSLQNCFSIFLYTLQKLRFHSSQWDGLKFCRDYGVVILILKTHVVTIQWGFLVGCCFGMAYVNLISNCCEF